MSDINEVLKSYSMLVGGVWRFYPVYFMALNSNGNWAQIRYVTNRESGDFGWNIYGVNNSKDPDLEALAEWFGTWIKG